MNLKKTLTAETISLNLQGTTKDAVLAELVDLLMASGHIRDRDAVLKAVQEREKRMSTGMQNGIAIPHGKSDSVDCLVAALGIKRSGVDFGALDGQPSVIFVMTVSPDSRTGPHIQFLAEISRPLNDPAVRAKLLAATTPDEVLHLLLG
ncbi:MAG TPA: PTS sugar transporter subunit IIA [Kiritimatiellia bacterium]|jgi:PTS system nitrogen regulatory IIA component|nr:PTS sugar transporter subunit IIA [Kiritimatiellia bacterium]OQC57893.1 MAG: PTS system fructose-specific EIIABC component [Verrucomicrobia bacterium ADurb.Bin018]MBP9572705.1 PTS sugar transporter subunit IIA [Kiritimatiellia bacterium]HOE01438.1 PTS sugar transporter subunit IIA [Kiritimatiellia bacterium]HOE37542.1 PTS sugar transporter subunit IIA [Kiritimatiellia bacterium]